MSKLIIPRRQFLAGLGATLFAAPAIVRAASLMPVKSFLDLGFGYEIPSVGDYAWQGHVGKLALWNGSGWVFCDFPPPMLALGEGFP